jgi:hypothetical protein
MFENIILFFHNSIRPSGLLLSQTIYSLVFLAVVVHWGHIEKPVTTGGVGQMEERRSSSVTRHGSASGEKIYSSYAFTVALVV